MRSRPAGLAGSKLARATRSHHCAMGALSRASAPECRFPRRANCAGGRICRRRPREKDGPVAKAPIARPGCRCARRLSSNLDSVVGPASSSLSGRFSQPTVLPSGQVKIGCWPGSLSLQPVTLQSAALATPDTPANTERPSKAAIIVLMIILLQESSAIPSNVATRHGNVCDTIALISLVLPKADAKLGHHKTS